MYDVKKKSNYFSVPLVFRRDMLRSSVGISLSVMTERYNYSFLIVFCPFTISS